MTSGLVLDLPGMLVDWQNRGSSLRLTAPALAEKKGNCYGSGGGDPLPPINKESEPGFCSVGHFLPTKLVMMR